MKKFILLVCVLWCSQLSAETQVLVVTSMGSMTLSLDEQKAPVTVANFLNYVDKGFYNNTIFHRVIPNFMIQGGGFDAEMRQKATDSPIKNEAANGLKNTRGTIAMARTNQPNSATSQFFINQKDNSFLNASAGNAGYAVFGKVISGIEVLDNIAKVATTSKQGHGDVPVEPVLIVSIQRVETQATESVVTSSQENP